MRRSVLLFCAFVAALVPGASMVRAEGNNTLESSSPAANEIITVAPTQLQLKFTNPAGTAEEVAQMGLALTCTGRLIGLGTPQVSTDGLTVSAALTQIPPNGSCTVSWKLADNSAGSFSFESLTQPTTTTIAGAQPGQTTVPGQTTTASPVKKVRLGGPIGLVRWIAFLFVSALFGGLLFVRFLWPEGVEYDLAERYFRMVGIATVVSMAALLALTTAAESGGSVAKSLIPTEWFSIADINEGRALLLRFAAIAFLAFIAWIPERYFEPTFVTQTSVALGLLALSFGFDRAVGHSLVIGIPVAILHMTFVMLLVGITALVWRVVLFGPGEADLLHALRTWARLSTPLAIGIAVTGIVQTWRLDGISLINTGHGRMILLKVLVVGLMVFVGLATRSAVLHGMRGARKLNQRAVFRLKHPVGIQLAIGVVVLAFSSILMSMRPPYVLLRDRGPKYEYAITQDLTGKDDFHVRVSITPGNVGNNRLLVEYFGPKRIQNFTVSLTPSNTAFNGFKVYVPLTRPGAALLTEETGMKLLAPGDWTITVEGTTTTGDLEPLKGSFVIADGVTVTTLANKNMTATTTTVPAGTVPPAADTTTTTVAQQG